MEIVKLMVEWTQDVFGAFGGLGLFVLAFIEGIFFPIPVEVLLIPLCLANPELFIYYGIIASIGSAVGGAFGYYVGYVGKKAVLDRLFSQEQIGKVHNMFVKYQDLAVFVAGFTPLPWKLITISSGAFYIKFWRFFVVALISRSLRFMSVAFLTYYFGSSIVGFLDKNFNLWTVIIVLVVFLAYYLYMKIKGKKALIWI